jgi:hypothetical protein
LLELHTTEVVLNERHRNIEYEVCQLTENGGWEWGISSLNIAGRASTWEEAIARAKEIIERQVEKGTFPHLVMSE